MTEPNYKSCPSHCCPRHGCKYGYGEFLQPNTECPVVARRVAPTYIFNNGCELCEADRYEVDRLREEGLIPDFNGYDVIATVAWTWESFTEAKTPLLQAHYLLELANAVSDLSTWHPDFNLETGEIEGLDE